MCYNIFNLYCGRILRPIWTSQHPFTPFNWLMDAIFVCRLTNHLLPDSHANWTLISVAGPSLIKNIKRVLSGIMYYKSLFFFRHFLNVKHSVTERNAVLWKQTWSNWHRSNLNIISERKEIIILIANDILSIDFNRISNIKLPYGSIMCSARCLDDIFTNRWMVVPFFINTVRRRRCYCYLSLLFSDHSGEAMYDV